MQKTIKRSVSAQGLGLHTGLKVNLTLNPAPPDTGIIFRRVDLNNFEIKATTKHIAKVSYATTLMRKGVMVATVEHLLSAIYGLGIDNLIIELDSLEVPIMDGSAIEFVKLIEEAGIEAQPSPKEQIIIKRPIQVRQGEKSITLSPDSKFRISYQIDFAHPAIGKQSLTLELTPQVYRTEIAPARTFGFYEEAQMLRRAGLIRGGSLENAIVLDANGILNENLRFADEFVRHKILDLIGDISLIGRPIIGHIRAVRAGHALHAALISQLLKDAQAYEVVSEAEEATDAAVKTS